MMPAVSMLELFATHPRRWWGLLLLKTPTKSKTAVRGEDKTLLEKWI